METFDTAVANFRLFLVQQDYPPNLLWLPPNDIVYWELRFTPNAKRNDGQSVGFVCRGTIATPNAE